MSDQANNAEPCKLWTIGHSTRAIEEFILALQLYRIEVLVDVRSFPGSSRYPHFNQHQLSDSLSASGIKYLHLSDLGGRRRPLPQSVNTAWRNASFRGYADYMETDAFKSGVARLLREARARRTAIMCAEALWWRCHRALVADYLLAQGLNVIHILGVEKSEEHRYTKAARVVEGRLSYEGTK